MDALRALTQAAGVAYAAGFNLYATVGVLGLAARFGLIGPLPGNLSGVTSWWVIGVALILTTIEFLASLVPAIASVWDTMHSFIRPPAAAALAAATTWQGDPAFVLVAALLGGGVAATTHATKLGLRYAVDASPEPVSNGIMSVSELGLVTLIAIAIWNHPFVTLAIAVAILIALLFLVRLIWRSLRRAFAGVWLTGRRMQAEQTHTGDSPDQS